MTNFIGPLIVLLLASIAFTIHYYQKCKDKKREIRLLKQELQQKDELINAKDKRLANFKNFYSKDQVNQIILNPPKFKIGETIGEYIIVQYEIIFKNNWTVFALMLLVGIGKACKSKINFSMVDATIEKEKSKAEISYNYKCHKVGEEKIFLSHRLQHTKTESKLLEIQKQTT